MTPQQARAALALVATAAVSDASVLATLGVDAVVEGVPDVIGHYQLGSAALAADYYDDAREVAAARGRFRAEPVIPDRVEKVRRAALWAAKPLRDATIGQSVESRIREVVQREVARAHRDTITVNRRRDPQAVGWRRITRAGACKYCLFLSSRGAIYKRETARFAAHNDCNCTAAPVFLGGAIGPEASVAQYAVSSRHRNPVQQARLRDLLNADYPDAPG